MGKGMSIAGMVIGGLVALIFVLNAFAGFPLGGTAHTGLIVNLGLALCGGILAYLGWSAFRDGQ
jgi:hypothetical protein